MNSSAANPSRSRRRGFFGSYLRPHPGWFALLFAVGLAAIGISAIGTTAPRSAAGQTRWLVISMCVVGLCMIPRPKTIGLWSRAIFILHLLVLVILILPFAPRGIMPEINGATSWIKFGSMSFQPSETAKIAFVLAMAWYLRQPGSVRKPLGLLAVFGITLVPVLLIAKQPDLGTALLFGPTVLVMLLVAGARLKHLGILVGVAIAIVAINIAAVLVLPPSMQLLKPHQQNRIRAMAAQIQGDTRYINAEGYQQDRAITLIGSGGLRGYGKDRAAELIEMNKLPEEHNDMIFVVIVNRWGLLGGLGTLALYGLLALSLAATAAVAKSPFIRLSVVGFAGLLCTQVFINVGVATGLMPVTGITLPFVSYGGSSLMSMFMMIGLVMNFAARPPAVFRRSTVDYDRREQTSAIAQ